jgi:uncharacterized coiled-coil protein SlyX
VTDPNSDPTARIDDLESRLTLADHAIGELSDEVYRQQKKLTELESLIDTLTDRLQQFDATQSTRHADDDIPPHY